MAQTAPRFPQLDVLRGFAVMGIFWVNVIYFGWPYDANLYPILFGGMRELNVLGWGFIHLLVEGAMFALFSMLFGASSLMLLSGGRLAGPGGLRAVDLYYRRNLWLIAFGLLHAFVLLWPLEILFTYGVLGLVLFPLRNLKPRTLLLLGVLMIAWGTNPLPSLLPEPQDAETSQPTQTPQTAATVKRLSDDELLKALDDRFEDMGVELALYHSDYLTIFSGNVDVAIGQQTTNLYEDNVWDAGGMMLVGMALFKWGVLTGQRSLLFYLLMTLLGFASAILLRLPGVSAGIESGFDPEQIRFLSSVPSLLGRLPLALGYVGLIMLLCRWERLRFLTGALAAAGRLAFTHYVLQTVFSILVFYGFGLALFGAFPYYQLILLAMLFGAIQVVLSVYWLRHFRQGPLEWLWRSLVQLKRQPFRRVLSSDDATSTPAVVADKPLPVA